MDEETPACAECLKHDGGWAAWCDECHVLAREELTEIRARLAAVEAALMQGGQTAQIRCTAAMLALDGWTTTPPNAPAAARGEGDRPVEPPCTCDGPVTQDGAQHRTWCGQEGDHD